MKNPEYDEIDALLEGLNDDNVGAILDEQDDSEAELDALIGAIDQEFLSDDEDIYLDNSNFINDTPNKELDPHFVQIQNGIVDNIEDILEEFSGGCMSGEHFGLDPEYELIEQMNIELGAVEHEDSMGADGSCMSCGSHNVVEGSCVGCGSMSRESRQARRENRRENRQDRKESRQSRRGNRKESRQSRRESRQTRRGVRQENRQTRRGVRQENRQTRRGVRQENRQTRRGMRQISRGIRQKSRQFAKIRRQYIRLSKSLEKGCSRFKNLGIKNKKYRELVNKNMLTAVSAPASMATNPFTVMSSMHIDRFGDFSEVVETSLELASDFGATTRRISRLQKRQERLQKRQGRKSRRRMTRKQVRLMKAAKVCDQKYSDLIQLWKQLNRLGNTSGLKSPQQIIGTSASWMKSTVKKSQKNIRLTQAEKSRIRRAGLISRQRMQKLREERRQERAEQLRRMKMLEEQRRQDKIDANLEARQDLKELQAVSPYIYDDDLKALEDAALIGKRQKREKMFEIGPVLPPVRRPVLPPVRRQVLPPVRRQVRPPAPSPVRRPSPVVLSVPPRRRQVRPPAPSPVIRRPAPVVLSVPPRRRQVRPPAPSPVVRRPAPVVLSVPPRGRQVRPPVRRPDPIREIPSLRRPSISSKKIADLEKKIKMKEQGLQVMVKKHKKSLDAMNKAKSRNLNPKIIQSHYENVKKYASASSRIREEIEGYKIQLTTMRRGLK